MQTMLKQNSDHCQFSIYLFFLCFIFCSSARATINQGNGDIKISITGNNMPLRTIFKAITKQSGLYVMYSGTITQINQDEKVNVQFKSARLDDVLSFLFKDKNLTWKYNDVAIVLFAKSPDNTKKNVGDSSITLPVVIGKVTDAEDKPVPGATIIVKGTKEGTVTDAEGVFYLSNIHLNSTLIVSSLGYKPREIDVKTKTLKVKLNVAVNELDQTLVIGYGTTTRRFSTGDIGVVRAEDIEKQPIMNPLLALQGRVAGVEVTQTSGYASAPVKVEIRGRNSINNSFTSDPLYVIDGVPLTVLDVSNTSSYQYGSTGFLQNGNLNGPANGQSPLFSINPADIQSIEILKDADATSIYGSRAANGVILITTKKGKAGKTKFDINVQQGITQVSRFYKLLNTPQYLALRREAFKNDGITPDAGNARDLVLWDTTRYTDWQRAIYGGMGRKTNIQTSISGGDARTTFRVGAGYDHVTNILTVDGADQRASVAVSLSNQSLNQKLTISLSANYSLTQSDMVSLPGRIDYAPNAPPIFDSLGNLNWAGWAPDRSNPFTNLKQPYTAKTNLLNTNLVLTYRPFQGMSISTSAGYNNAQANQVFLTPIASQDPRQNPLGLAQFGNNSNRNWIIEPQLNYESQIGNGKLSIMVGATLQSTHTQGLYVQGSGYKSDALLRTITNAPNKYASDNYGENKYAAVFGRIGYILANKYIFNLNVRRDGSSNFGVGNQFGNFGSLGAAWIFTDEDWFKENENLRWLSFGKLSANYGTTGGDGPPYAYLTRWTSSGTLPYSGNSSLTPTQHANPNYKWQLNRKLEGAISLGFFKDWVTLYVAYYRNRCGNQLMSYPIPSLTGFQTVVTNLDALVQNEGWEFTIGGKGVQSKYFTWAPSFNFSINRNKLISYPNLATSPVASLFAYNQPLNIARLLHYIGVDPKTGQYAYQDKNHDGVINPNGIDNKSDLFIYKLTPSFSTGFGSNFDYAGIHLSLFFTVRKQKAFNQIAQGQHPGVEANQPIDVLGRWQKPGDVSNIARFTTQPVQSDNLLGVSDAGYTDASYIRLSNLSLSFDIPEKLIKRTGIKNCSLFFNTNNLFTITRYKGIDPETQNFGGLPPTKTIVGGISLSL